MDTFMLADQRRRRVFGAGRAAALINCVRVSERLCDCAFRSLKVEKNLGEGAHVFCVLVASSYTLPTRTYSCTSIQCVRAFCATLYSTGAAVAA